MNFLNGQTIYLDNQPAHWCVHFCVGFLFFCKISVVGSVVFDNQECCRHTSPLLSGVTKDVLLLALHLGKVKV